MISRKLAMNSLSELQYPTFFAGNKREVKLKGEAFFDVTHNEKMPFVVETQKYNVEVLGTSFDVEAYPDSKDFLASLVRGKVKVVSNTNAQEEIFLSPNEQVYTVNGKLSVRDIPDMDAFNWRDGILSFKGDSFLKIMGKIEKCYDLKIIVAKSPAPQKEFFGKIKISDGVDHILRVLQKNTQFKYRWDDNMRVVYANPELARTEAEKSIANSIGVITEADEKTSLQHSANLVYHHPLHGSSVYKTDSELEVFVVSLYL